MLVIVHCGLQLVFSKTISVGDTRYHINVVIAKVKWDLYFSMKLIIFR